MESEGLGGRIRRLRVAKGLTQDALGERVGLSRRMVAYYEVQGGEPRPELLLKLASALGVSVDVLAGLKPTPMAPSEPPVSPRLLRRIKKLEELPAHDQKAVLRMIDMMVEARRKTA
ncbi:MAG: helix-turn-helix transcriptional regulator [Acidobacteria bacterium]|nr:helix-turn-helix transcriptional regulator [Acidobacteriota bacterium]